VRRRVRLLAHLPSGQLRANRPGLTIRGNESYGRSKLTVELAFDVRFALSPFVLVVCRCLGQYSVVWN